MQNPVKMSIEMADLHKNLFFVVYSNTLLSTVLVPVPLMTAEGRGLFTNTMQIYSKNFIHCRDNTVCKATLYAICMQSVCNLYTYL